MYGGVQQTLVTTFAHEMGGHAAASLYPELRNAINSLTAKTLASYLRTEGYAVTYENVYRGEAGLDKRIFYETQGDYLPPRSDVRIFPPSFP